MIKCVLAQIFVDLEGYGRCKATFCQDHLFFAKNMFTSHARPTIVNADKWIILKNMDNRGS